MNRKKSSLLDCVMNSGKRKSPWRLSFLSRNLSVDICSRNHASFRNNVHRGCLDILPKLTQSETPELIGFPKNYSRI